MSQEKRTEELLKRVDPAIRKLLDAHRQMILGDFGDSACRDKYANTFNNILEAIAVETMP